MYSTKRLHIVTISLSMLLGVISTVAATQTIPVASASCKYNIQIPDEWDTIPQTALKEKTDKIDFDLGIYPAKQSGYYTENYVFIGFLPTQKSPNSLSRKKILSFISETNKSYEQKTDTLTCIFDSLSFNTQNNSIYSYFSIEKDTLSYRNCQILYPSKFGFISVWVYKKGGSVPLEETLSQLANLIQIQDNYKYVEPQGGISLMHILIALGVGLLVYCIIAFLPKFKKKQA